METYECIVIVFMISLCWGNELHPATETNEIADDNQKGGSTAVEEKHCPTWYRETKYNGVTRCVCGARLGIDVVCNASTQKTLILVGFCMSYDEKFNGTVIGDCPFNYYRPSSQHFYVTLPNDTSKLNSFMCSGLNRTGLLCSKCQKGLGPAVLSYKWRCVECFDKQYGWLVYITATLLPTTILCLLVMVFQLRVASAEMNAFVFLCQFITCVVSLTNPYMYVQYSTNPTIVKFLELGILTFYGIWNLDFFRYFLPSFCISSDMTTLHTLALEYVVAIYPLLLTLVIYICIELYDRGVRVVVCVWTPFRVCFARFRRRWNPKESVIHTFAAFMLLSYSKLLTVSYSLLDASKLHNNRGERVGPAVLYYDASIEYFSRGHLPFAVLALCVLLVFAVFPLLLLLLYPMRSFQRCLGYCTGIRWHFLHTFADAFQGCYKNGTNGTHDYRYFAGLYFVIRIAILVGFIATTVYMWLMIVLFPAVISLLFALFRPYKKSCFNYIDSLGFASLALTTFLIMYAIQTRHTLILTVLYVMASIPFLYFISLLFYKILSQVALIRTCCRKIGETLRARNTDEELPDRIVNPHMYQPLLAVVNYSSDEEGDSESDCQPQPAANSLSPYGSL